LTPGVLRSVKKMMDTLICADNWDASDISMQNESRVKYLYNFLVIIFFPIKLMLSILNDVWMMFIKGFGL
jgi:hypothetical protein